MANFGLVQILWHQWLGQPLATKTGVAMGSSPADLSLGVVNVYGVFVCVFGIWFSCVVYLLHRKFATSEL